MWCTQKGSGDISLVACINRSVRLILRCCAGDFSEMMRRQGATGDDWSDWDVHLPGSPQGSSGLPEALSSLSLSRSLSKQTSDKFEVAEGKPPLHKAQKGRTVMKARRSQQLTEGLAPTSNSLHNHGSSITGCSIVRRCARRSVNAAAAACLTITCKPTQCKQAWTRQLPHTHCHATIPSDEMPSLAHLC